MSLPYAVRQEVERIRDDLPIRDDRYDVVVDRHVRILVYHRSNPAQVPPIVRVETQQREVEGIG
jgi:hypothetical protein